MKELHALALLELDRARKEFRTQGATRETWLAVCDAVNKVKSFPPLDVN